MVHIFTRLAGLFFVLVLLAGCAPAQPAADAGAGGRLQAVATTTLVSDVVSRIAGDRVELVTLLPPGIDPHSYQPTPRDITQIAAADLVFANGLGLEDFLAGVLDSANTEAQVIAVSAGIAPLELGDEHEEAEESQDPDHSESGQDPHVWMDPNNVLVWVDNIEAALIEADPENASLYAENAEQYRQELRELDEWVRQQVDQLPEARRKLVTDHAVFGYFARRYGFEQVGAVIPGFSTLSEPSAQDLAALQQAIAEQDGAAIFVGSTINPNFAEQVAEDTGAQLVQVYTGSLTAPDGPAPTYLDFIQYNVEAIVSALK